MKPSLGAGTLLELLEVDVSIFIIENPPSSSAGTLLHDIKHAISLQKLFVQLNVDLTFFLSSILKRCRFVSCTFSHSPNSSAHPLLRYWCTMSHHLP